MEPGQRGQPGVDLAELGHARGGEVEALDAPLHLLAREALVEPGQLGGHRGPDLVLLGRVVDVGDGIPRTVAAADLGDVGAALEVLVVADPRVVRRKGQNQLAHAPMVTEFTAFANHFVQPRAARTCRSTM